MHKPIASLLIAASAALAFVSCAKEEAPQPPHTETDGSAVTLTFVADDIASQTRAFFSPTASTEVWEKELNSLTLFVFDPAGKLIVQRDFTAPELSSKKAIFALPRSASGLDCKFYAVANKSISDVNTETALLAVLDGPCGSYNGTFSEVSARSLPNNGFVMSGSATKTVAAANMPTDVAIVLKRTVAKIALQASMSSGFSDKYPGTVRINSATVSRAASQTPVVMPAAPAPGAMSFRHTQPATAVSGNYLNLFYLYESGTQNAGSRVLVELDATYDMDGDFATTGDQTPIIYSFELDGTGSGKIVRNGYYRVEITLSGLSGQDVNAIITVADWETPVTQNINLGQ